MSILIDSSVLIGYYHGKDFFHETAQKIMSKIDGGEYGDAVVSDYVLDESVTVVEARTKSKPMAVALGEHLMSSAFNFLKISQPVFDAAWEKFKKTENLSFTDCTSLALCEMNGITAIATFDKGFKKQNEIRIVDG